MSARSATRAWISAGAAARRARCRTPRRCRTRSRCRRPWRRRSASSVGEPAVGVAATKPTKPPANCRRRPSGRRPSPAGYAGQREEPVGGDQRRAVLALLGDDDASGPTSRTSRGGRARGSASPVSWRSSASLRITQSTRSMTFTRSSRAMSIQRFIESIATNRAAVALPARTSSCRPGWMFARNRTSARATASESFGSKCSKTLSCVSMRLARRSGPSRTRPSRRRTCRRRPARRRRCRCRACARIAMSASVKSSPTGPTTCTSRRTRGQREVRGRAAEHALALARRAS